jgi:streptogramin lyase
MLPAEQALTKITPFLDDKTTDPAIQEELQMGAVSALSDIEHPGMMEPLLAAYTKLALGNQALAREAMQRTDQRKLAWDIYQSDLKEQVYYPLPLTLDHAFTEGIEGPASDSQGNVYAVNFLKQQTIGKVDRWGNGSLWANLPDRGTGNGIVFDSQGDLLVADYVEHKIWRIDRVTGLPSLVCHEPAMNQPNDLAIAEGAMEQVACGKSIARESRKLSPMVWERPTASMSAQTEGIWQSMNRPSARSGDSR